MAAPDRGISLLVQRRADVKHNADAVSAYEFGGVILLAALSTHVPFLAIPAIILAVRSARNFAKGWTMDDYRSAESYFQQEEAIAAEPQVRRITRHVLLQRPTFSPEAYNVTWTDSQ